MSDIYTVECDKCKKHVAVENVSPNRLRGTLINKGWRLLPEIDICPDCPFQLNTKLKSATVCEDCHYYKKVGWLFKKWKCCVPLIMLCPNFEYPQYVKDFYHAPIKFDISALEDILK